MKQSRVAVVTVLVALAAPRALRAATTPCRIVRSESRTIDRSLVRDELKRCGEVTVDVSGPVALVGDWSLPEGTIRLHARGAVVADGWRLSSPGSKLTIDAPEVRLLGRTRIDVARSQGPGGDVTLTSDVTHGTIEIGREASIDASGSPGQGGRVVLSGNAVMARGALAALGQGRIEVEARNALRFFSHADTGGGLIRLDPTNLRIGAFTDTDVTASPDIHPNNPPNNGLVSASGLGTLLASNSVVVHTTGMAGDMIGPGTGLSPNTLIPGMGLPTGDAVDGDITVEAPVTWSSAFSLTLMAHDDLFILAPVQNGGAGDVVGVSGWDGMGGAAAAASFGGASTPSNTTYGAAGGDTFLAARSNPDVNALFGSRGGFTNVWANQLNVLGSANASGTFGGYSMVGFALSDGSAATGAIRVNTNGNVTLQGGASQAITSAQIGHGGGLWTGHSAGNSQGNLSGAITVNAGGALTLHDAAGGGFNGAQIGHGGEELEEGMMEVRGNLSGAISVTVANALTLTADSAVTGYAQIGHGGNVDKATTEGTIDGAINVTAASVHMTTKVGLMGGAKIGHGGSAATSINPASHVNSIVGNIGSIGAPISVTATSGDVVLDNVLVNGFSGVSQIGHGGQIVFSASLGSMAGDITVNASGNVSLSAGGNCNNQCGSQIGHSATAAATATSTVGTASGHVNVTAGGTISVVGGGATNGGNSVQFAQIGHGGPLQGAQDSFGPPMFTLTSGTLTWSGTPGQGSNVTVSGASVNVQGGIGAYAYAQIGNGGMVYADENTYSHVSRGSLDGNVSVTATTGDLQVLAGADTAKGAAAAHIGNGGQNASPAGVMTVMDTGANGSVTINVQNETSLADAMGGSKWWLGHRTAGALANAPVTLDTGKLDFTAGSGAPDVTIIAPFWDRFVADPAPTGPEMANAVGGVVTLRAHGSGANGVLISDESLTVPAGITNDVHVISTMDMTFHNPVTNSGSGFVDLVSDDANPNPPNFSMTAAFTLGASAAPVGNVRLYAVAPALFTNNAAMYMPMTTIGVWYQTFGMPIVGVNFKVAVAPVELIDFSAE